jgi:hypothetical protein
MRNYACHDYAAYSAGVLLGGGGLHVEHDGLMR